MKKQMIFLLLSNTRKRLKVGGGKKIAFIEETNAGWIDLADGWFEE